MTGCMTAGAPLLDVSDLSLGIGETGRLVVDRVGFQVRAGEIVAVVGESGSGKSSGVQRMWQEHGYGRRRNHRGG